MCDPADVEHVLQAAPSGPEETFDLVSTYFDTPEGDLRQAGVSLRIREGAGARTQTLKRGQGLSRLEIETPLVGEQPNLNVGPLPDLLPPDAQADLRPVFRVTVRRRARRIRLGAAEIELALDQGEIRAGGRSLPICEVELELISGPEKALFELARLLSSAAPLYLSFESKSARGQALLQGASLEARKRPPVEISAGATTAAAFQAIARAALFQIAANGEVLRRIDDPGAIHQLRVAARRLRSIISTFGEILREAGRRDVAGELRWLARACDEARNLDVFTLETVQPALDEGEGPSGMSELSLALEAARVRAHADVAGAVSSARYRSLLLETACWIECGAWLYDPDPATRVDRARPARDFAAEALQGRRRKLLKRGRKLKALSNEERHEVRIQAKKLRYAAESFAPMFDERAARRFIEPLRHLQDQLGALNDLAGVEDLLRPLQLEARAAFAAGYLVGERAAQRPRLLRSAAEAMDELAQADRFWR